MDMFKIKKRFLLNMNAKFSTVPQSLFCRDWAQNLNRHLFPDQACIITASNAQNTEYFQFYFFREYGETHFCLLVKRVVQCYICFIVKFSSFFRFTNFSKQTLLTDNSSRLALTLLKLKIKNQFPSKMYFACWCVDAW